MQNTRLNVLLTTVFIEINRFFSNPWRKLSLIILALFIGFFLSTTVSSSLGQTSLWDPSIALVFLIFSEVVNIIAYRGYSRQDQPLWINTLNAFKIGFVYGVYLDGIRLNS